MRLQQLVRHSLALCLLVSALASGVEAQEITPENAGDAVKQVFDLSQRATSLAEYEQVIDLCEKIMAAPVDEAKTSYARRLAAWAYNRRGETKAEQATALAEKGEEEQAADLDKQAFGDFARSIELDSTKWKAYHNRGVGNAMAGEFEAAQADFSKALELESQYSNTWFNRGEIYFEQGKYQQAIDDYNQALQLKPGDVQAISRRGRAYAATGQHAEAVGDFTQVIRLAPQDVESYIDRAESLETLKRWPAAADDFRQAVRLGPSSARAYREAAWFLATCPDAQFRNDALAGQAIARAVELAGQDDYRTLETQAAVLASAGNSEQAVARQQAAIELAPKAFQGTLQTRLKVYQAGQPYRQAN